RRRAARPRSLLGASFGAPTRSSASCGVRYPPRDAHSEAGELVAQRAEAHAAQVEGVALEPLQVELVSVTPSGVGPGLQPHPFADLVADRLTGPAEVAVDLAP